MARSASACKTKKICSKCKQEKDLSEFRMRSDKPHLYKSHCIQCKAIKDKERSKVKSVKYQEFVATGKQRCSQCDKLKDPDAFGKSSSSLTKLKGTCRECREIAAKVYRQSDKGKASDKRSREKAVKEGRKLTTNMKYKYKLEPEEYLALLENNPTCEICGKPFDEGSKRCVDHDHVTKKVRGLLCHNCNITLGLMFDNPAMLRKAADYLEK